MAASAGVQACGPRPFVWPQQQRASVGVHHATPHTPGLARGARTPAHAQHAHTHNPHTTHARVRFTGELVGAFGNQLTAQLVVCMGATFTGSLVDSFGPRLTASVVEAIGARDIAELVAVGVSVAWLACGHGPCTSPGAHTRMHRPLAACAMSMCMRVCTPGQVHVHTRMYKRTNTHLCTGTQTHWCACSLQPLVGAVLAPPQPSRRTATPLKQYSHITRTSLAHTHRAWAPASLPASSARWG